MTEKPDVPKPPGAKSGTPPHYRMTWEQAQQDYKDGLITQRGLIYYAVACRGKPGQYRLNIPNVAEFCKVLNIDRATYYRAIAALKSKGRLELDAPGGMVLWVPTIEEGDAEHAPKILSTDEKCCKFSAPVAENHHLLQPCDKLSQQCDTVLQQCDNSPERENLKSPPDREPEKRGDVPITTNNQLNNNKTLHPVFPGINREEFGTSELINWVKAAGIEPNKTIQKVIGQILKTHTPAAALRAVENALSAVQEQLTEGNCRNPGGMFVAALRQGYTANEAKRQARDKPKVSEPPPLNQVAAAVDQALLCGDREFALAKLQSLWDEGYHDLLEELLYLFKRDWQFELTNQGVRDATEPPG